MDSYERESAQVVKARAVVLDNHRMVRNGSLWACMHCPAAWPFPAPVPSDAGPCVPRPWREES